MKSVHKRMKNPEGQIRRKRLNYSPNVITLTNTQGKRPVPASLIDAICKTYIVDKEWL